VSVSQKDLNDQVARVSGRGAKPSEDIWIHTLRCSLWT